ncbi:TPA: hypothetical protein ACH3X2_002140 [Trebouxia sp. C0005]
MQLADSVALKEVLPDADADMNVAQYKPDLEGSAAPQGSCADSQPAEEGSQPRVAAWADV